MDNQIHIYILIFNYFSFSIYAQNSQSNPTGKIHSISLPNTIPELPEGWAEYLERLNIEQLSYSNAVPDEIQNIDELFVPFQQNNCLTVLDYFLQHPTSFVFTYPVIIRNMKPMLFEYTTYVDNFFELVLVPRQMNITKEDSSKWNPSICKVSQFLQDNIAENVCLSWNMLKLIAKWKPWQCIVQVAIFVPPTLFDFHSYPYINRYHRHNINLDFNTFETSFFIEIVLHGFINEREVDPIIEKSKSISTIANIRTTRTPLNLSMPKIALLQRFFLIKDYQHVNLGILLSEWANAKIENLKRLRFPDDEQLVWNIPKSFTEEITKEIHKCESIYEI